MDDSIRTAKYTPLNYHYSRVCLVCGETERYSSPTTATIVDTSIPWLCDRCRETLLKLIEDANTSNALNALEQENKESKEEVTDTNVGKWMYKKITNELHVVGQCSVCKERRIIDNYCPNCGADMRGEHDE